MKAKVSIVTVNPTLAQKLLDNLFPGQRPVSLTHVSRMAVEMEADEWRLSPDCLVLIKGMLANGQHRLAALVRAKKTLQFLILETDDDQLYKIMDCGNKRTVADVIQGQHAKNIAAAARIIVLYDLECLSPNSGGTGMGSKAHTCTRSLCIEYAESQHGKLLELATICSSLSKQNRIIPVSMAVAVAFIAKRDWTPAQSELVDPFIQHVFDGESQNDAARDFRERIIRACVGSSRLPRWHIMALLIKSLCSYRNGTRMSVVRMNEGEKFPRLK